ncbi:hypothetical protein [Flammeovirga agarivorans]|uniref:Uncharacterized protein n=1 Tax=Flammeovirga agarivorans TaxID=2726742 RepID=A0A7X8SI17_9BACT|nr:hypothetical protein [Flammeovirga agarivorans]NLR90584.1 hypothetical protein [Flammeovirga agarivorans]
MIWLFNSILLIYLILSNIAIIVRMYRSFLQYLSPIKGYTSMILIIGVLGAVDYYVFDITSDKFEIFDENQEVFKQIEERGNDFQELTKQ